ncbi:MAG: Oxidoreductase molybdopterin binding [Ilumatobacteraceae bacterium]|nr:Oxidoreductase molybdopterin binding [Ilumatobacteraceae bacterium]
MSDAEPVAAEPAGVNPPGAGSPVGRRIVLGLAALGAAGIVTGRTVQDHLARWLAPIQNADPTGLTGLLPLGATFRYYSVTGSVPTKNATNYQLEVGGLVANPTTYTLGQLQALPQTMLTRDFQCVTGWRVPEVHWSGVRLSDLLDAAEPTAAAAAISFGSFDGTYTESLTLDQARRSDVIVALQMLGKPVTHDHGGPVRMYVAPMYGYKSTKWLSSIEVTSDVVPGYWENEGNYDVDGWIGDSNGRDDDPVG